MKNFVLIYEDNSRSVNHRFFRTDSRKIPFVIGQVWFSDEMNLTKKQKTFLEKLNIEFEPEESIIIYEIPEKLPEI